MSEYATRPTNTDNPVLDPRAYWRVSAVALLAAAALGSLVNVLWGNHEGIAGFLVFDWLHNGLHLFLGLAAAAFGWAPIPGNVQRVFAIVFGVVYGGLGVVGLILWSFELVPGLHVELAENLIHVALGAWGLAAGFAARY